MKSIEGNDLDAEALKEKAGGYFKQGYNCAQAVICAVGPELGLDVDTASRLAKGLGGGMGNGKQACGALSGGVVVLSYANNKDADSPKGKGSSYKLSSDLMEEFEKREGSTRCSEIRTGGLDTPVPPICAKCVADSTEITVEMLKEL